jgi:formate hydrogenlyase subunit 3/multisubunit Na+/H+ antiporter MnhD subunit
MNISGSPPTVGFVSKLMIFMGAFGPGTHGNTVEFVIALISILSTAFTVGYTMWTMRRIFHGPLPEHLSDVKEASPLMTVPMILLCVISILLGLYPKPILDPLLEIVAALLT